MEKKEVLIIADYAMDSQLTLQELCDICSISPELVRQLIAYEIIVPVDGHADEYYFNLTQFKRLQSALRLQRDLDINLAGIAIVLDLLDEVRELRAHAALLNKHLLK